MDAAEVGRYDTITLSCQARVAGEVVRVSVSVVRAAYANEGFRDAVRENLRMELMRKILERWTPVIRVTG